MDFKKISIKSFISDIANIFNYNFNKLSEFIADKFDFEKNKLKNIVDITIEGIIEANTAILKNLKVKGNAEVHNVVADKVTLRNADNTGRPVSVEFSTILEMQTELQDAKEEIAELRRMIEELRDSDSQNLTLS
jgi:hypothetical protein